MTKNWYVLYVKPKNEKKVAERLSANHIEVYSPMIKEVKQWSDRKKTIEVPLFKSYVFVNITEADRQQVFGIPGVVRYLYWLGKPAVVRDIEMETLKKWLSNDDVEDYTLTKLSPGDRVAIKNGALKDSQAIIKEVGKSRVKLILEGMGVVLNMKIRDLV
ncbi:transcription antitermination factor NusG [Maribacter spongiicola]|uniref:Transcription antitermination factor NusG n=1 Tax=Maribacter spongiicola TaxID=1206753 RepID=A0A4R7K776_9FLAO|nr:UpxY family transcription antiterminator [Maribacter spongiicola]TDT46739.1 transcription antitermination factor NusG [Maribacter spongiicola]